MTDVRRAIFDIFISQHLYSKKGGATTNTETTQCQTLKSVCVDPHLSVCGPSEARQR